MSEFHEQRDPSFDEQLRNVPLPAGLVARLRQIARADDDHLDDALCAVAVPKNLLNRLREIPVLSDRELDHRLDDVPVPQGLLASLQQISREPIDAEITSDAQLDQELQNVPVPRGLVRRTRRATRSDERRRSVIREFAVAASLFLAIGLSYFGAVTGFVMTAFGVGTEAPEKTLVVEAQQSMLTRPEVVSFESNSPTANDSMIATVPLVESMFEPELPAMVGPQPKGPEPILAPPIDWDLSKQQLALLRDVAEAKWGKFLAHQLVNEDTEIPQQIDGPRPGGLEPIFARGYDARVHAKYGVHPFVSAQTFKHFRSSRPPLVSSTLSYERARRDVLAGRRIDSNAVRIEEFLAAPDYALPMASRGEARLHMAGGKSPFAGRTQLVQVSLNVGDKLPRQRPPVHLVVAVDVSTSMSSTGRIDNVRKALGRLVDRMEPDDRISVIAFNEEASVLAEQLQRRDRRHLLDIIRSMEAAGATNLGAALQLAYSVAQTSVPASTTNKPFDRRVVVIGDGHTGMTPDAQFRIASLLTTAAREGISVQLVDHSVRTSPSAAMMAIAQASGCSALAAATPQELDWALDRWLTGDEPVVLTDAVLDVQFNPAVVTRYRLIGHGSQLRPGAAATNLRAGQVATVLYEVETIPNANGWVARAHVAWRDSASSKSRRTPTASLAKKELDTRFADTATSFQLAVVAAQMGEALKRSPYLKVSTKQAIRQAEQAAAQIDTQARNLPQNKRLLNFLKQLRRVRSW